MALQPAAIYGAKLALACGTVNPAAVASWTAIAQVFLDMIKSDAVVQPGIVPGVGLTYLNSGVPTSVTGTGTIG